MSVASHLGIDTVDYDGQIATFIPGYAALLDTAAAIAALGIPAGRPTRLVDLGIGSGALAARCLAKRPRLAVVGIDQDEAMLALAQRRLGKHLTTVVGDLETTPFPGCHAITASFSLHRLRTTRVKSAVYRRACRALRRGGRLVLVDRYLASDRALDRMDRDHWRAHLAGTYGPRQATAYLRAWAAEDVHFTLDRELGLLTTAGFRAEVVRREHGFAVVAAWPRRSGA